MPWRHGRSWQRSAALATAALAACKMDSASGDSGQVHWIIMILRKIIYEGSNIQGQ